MKNDAAEWYKRGVGYVDEQEYEKAIVCFTKAIEFDPKDAVAYYDRSNSYAVLGKYDLAIEDFGRANDLAIEEFTNAIKLKPENAHAYYRRA